MAEKRKRGQNFSADDKEKLIKLLVSHKETLLNKRTDGATNEAKHKAWNNVTDSFNSSGTNFRTKESLYKMWEKLKTESKFYYNKTHNMTGTGGGPADFKLNPILEQVCALLGRACTGIVGVQDCDIDSDEQIIENQAPNHKSTHSPKPSTSRSSCENDVPIKKCKTPTMPLWSRRRPQCSQRNERTEAVSSICSSFRNVNKKKEEIEELKNRLLQEEIDFKRKLYCLQLEAATKEVEIKTEILKKIKDGSLNIIQSI